MPDIQVNIEVFCDKCGAGLCSDTNSRKSGRYGNEAFYVAPCDKCLSAEYDKGYSDGRDEE